MCEALKRIPRTEDGNYELYGHGNELTYGQDIMVELNVDGRNDISVLRWYLKNGYVVGDRKRHEISYCPFCGEKLKQKGAEM